MAYRFTLLEVKDRKANLTHLQSSPLCIIAARGKEAEVVASDLGLTKLSGGIDGLLSSNPFWSGEITLRGGVKLPTYVTHCSRQGIQTFSIEAGTLFGILKPRYAIHVGVCAAYTQRGDEESSDVKCVPASNVAYKVNPSSGRSHEATRPKPVAKIGDVIFGHSAFNYEEGRWEADDHGGGFRADYVSHDSPNNFEGFLSSDPKKPTYYTGTFMSGCAVRKDVGHKRFGAYLSKVPRKDLRALDMESSAFIHLCNFLGIESLGVIKGVSDFADENKNAGENDYILAVEAVSKAATLWLKYRLSQIYVDLDLSKEVGYTAADAYYNNFVAPIHEAVMEFNRAKSLLRFASQSVQPLDQHTPITAIKVVKPAIRANNTPNVGAFKSPNLIMTRHGIQEAVFGGDNVTRGARIAGVAGTTIYDFPRTLTQLEVTAQPARQCDIFFQHLQELLDGDGDRSHHQLSDFVTVIPWADFVQQRQST